LVFKLAHNLIIFKSTSETIKIQILLEPLFFRGCAPILNAKLAIAETANHFGPNFPQN
jgi:hypothetical protein